MKFFLIFLGNILGAFAAFQTFTQKKRGFYCTGVKCTKMAINCINSKAFFDTILNSFLPVLVNVGCFTKWFFPNPCCAEKRVRKLVIFHVARENMWISPFAVANNKTKCHILCVLFLTNKSISNLLDSLLPSLSAYI